MSIAKKANFVEVGKSGTGFCLNQKPRSLVQKCKLTLAHKFWLCWMQGYFPTLKGRNKWRVTRNNIGTGNWFWLGMLRTSQGATLVVWAVYTGCTLSGATEKS